jgi:Omp85 superfamily domain
MHEAVRGSGRQARSRRPCRHRLPVIATAVLLLLSAVAARQAPAQTVSPPPAEKPGSGETLPPGTIAPATGQDSPAVVEFGAANVPVQKKPKKPGGGEIILAPVPFSNPTIGTGLGLGVGYLFHPDRKDTVSPPSMVLVGGLGSDNGTRGFLTGARLYLSKDRYRVVAGLARLDAHYDFYGIGTATADADLHIPLKQDIDGLLVEGLVRVAPRLYAGIRYAGGTSKTSIREETDSPLAQALSGKQLDTNISAINARLQWDLRNNTFFPTKGGLMEFVAGFHDDAWGDDFTYQTYTLTYAAYHAMGKRQVLAIGAAARTVSGDAPFFALSQVGLHDNLRGYVSTKYRDKSLLSLQVEYRQMLSNRFGFVLFTGASEVAKGIGDFNTSDILGSVGAGVRYRISKQQPINYRIDYAYGKDGGNLYFMVGEAF